MFFGGCRQDFEIFFLFCFVLVQIPRIDPYTVDLHLQLFIWISQSMATPITSMSNYKYVFNGDELGNGDICLSETYRSTIAGASKNNSKNKKNVKLRKF